MSQARALPRGLLPGINAGGTAIGAGRGVRKFGTGADQVSLPAANTDIVWGITMEEIPALGVAAGTVQTAGRAVAKAGGTFARGVEVEVTTDGDFIELATGRAVGVANTAGVDGADFELDLYGASAPPPA